MSDSLYPAKTNNSLQSLLTTLSANDAGLLEMTPEQQESIVLALSTKVDSLHYIDEKFESEVVRVSKRIEELQTAKRVLENNKKRLRELVVFHMKQNGFERLPGENYQVALIKRKSIEYSIDDKPSDEMIFDRPEFIRTSYAWNKDAISAAIKADPETYAIFGRLVEKEFLKFSIRRGV